MQVRFTRLAATLALGSLAAVAGPSQAETVKLSQKSGTEREVTELSQGWKFHFGPETPAVTAPDFQDDGWQTVSVPHTWNRIGTYAPARTPDTGNAQGTGWYRLTVAAPAAAPDMRQYLDFAAVGAVADVWVNGKHVGTHKGAFSRFRLDVTDAWKAGADNLIVVRADNSKPEPGNATSSVIPLGGDFFVHGGIYRNVSLLQLPSASIDPLDYGGPGTYARAAQVTESQAVIDVRTRLRNAGTGRNLTLTTQITDAKGSIVATAAQPVSLEKGTADVAQRLTIKSPHRWNGRADPYMYAVSATLSDGATVLDKVTQPLGIRTFRFDPDAGFFLNGQHVKLKGVSRHQDWLGSGWALTPEQHRKDMELIEELGANTIRQAHYQHADAWSDLADEAGMVVWAEIPYVSGPSLTGGEGTPQLWANAEQQLRELIRQDFNHPAVMMWSIGNEVDSSAMLGVSKEPTKPLALLKRLQEVAKEEDPSRPTTMADCCEDLGMMAKTAGEQVVGTADLVGYNRYYGWYYPKPLEARAELGAQLDKFHVKHPQLPISVSEYGAGGAVSQHSDDVTSGFVNFIGRPHPEEYEAWVHEQTWPAIAARDFVFASWVWNMFDFASDLRGEGDSIDLNDKGLVTADRKVRKDAFWFYKVAWSDTPAIHFAGKHYVARAYPVMTVKAYANAPAARLVINGRTIGEAPCPDNVCEWKQVPLAPGPNKAVVTATANGETVSDEMTWTGPDPMKQGIRIDAGNLAGSVLGKRQFGSDTFVTGGKPMVLNLGGFGKMTSGPPRTVEAAELRLFDYWRQGTDFSYGIPVPDGDWTVTLHLFEPSAVPPETQAVTVKANGTNVLDALNVAKAAGGSRKELVRSFPVQVSGGLLSLDFNAVGGNVSLAAIEVAR
ncbi:glycoside hydrolase family 2 TIM barrel-domain containing protein [Novosphingobium album (ex Hu et al. 2023)]|uniref:Malectin domain-containing carbohydrate-binding protein n=1 Tax=Novosphingobium album (ex Hu et al. 2023) TaxID=2930093 RepID=A0ABT0B5X4_9SPHN|nr:glycoside hydrolase family 2 TIM barrel-domain containing protein [Novosphingobium album (ex Hu et al. 2023)]MCJ2180271.1 malectin domain-containing carbohydrate-binding protein [Novosphingobium album (ex Hu et al. 2023)]